MTATGRIPVTIVSGFLGSGKTSLLRHMLTGAPDTAVIVNEFGAVGLDHELLRACEERVELIGGGCACCTRRQDLVRTLTELLDASQRGRIELSRVVIECSGLADPAPIVFTVTRDAMLRHHFDVERLVVTVDAVNGSDQLATHREVAKQVLVADELVITKVDLLEGHGPEALVSALAAVNPAAEISSALHGVRDRKPFRAATGERVPGAPEGSNAGHHTDDVSSLSVPADGPRDWLGFSLWLSMLLHARGEQVLRVKGLFELDDGTRVSVNGVQHVMHMPEHLPHSATAERAAGIVFITRGLDVERIRESLEVFQRLARAGASVRGS